MGEIVDRLGGRVFPLGNRIGEIKGLDCVSDDEVKIDI